MATSPPISQNWFQLKMKRASTASTPRPISPDIKATYQVGLGSFDLALDAAAVAAAMGLGLRLVLRRFDSGMAADASCAKPGPCPRGSDGERRIRWRSQTSE